MKIWLDCNKEVSPHYRVSKLSKLRWTQLTTGPAVSEMPWTVVTDRAKSLNDPTHGSRYYEIGFVLGRHPFSDNHTRRSRNNMHLLILEQIAGRIAGFC